MGDFENWYSVTRVAGSQQMLNIFVTVLYTELILINNFAIVLWIMFVTKATLC